MTSFRDKLARLRAPEPSGEDADRLARLRAQLGALHGAPAVGRRDEPATPALPFVVSEGPAGILHRRASLEPHGRQVGRLLLRDALDADPTILALLALTPDLAGCCPRRALFVDAETTGLGGGTGNKPFLVGMSWLDQTSGRWALEQLLLGEPDDEPAMLEVVRERVAAADFIVSYNGKAFDLPLLVARMAMNRLAPLPRRAHLDLLHLARRVHKRRAWRKSLITVEREVLGFDRGPDIDGEEVAARYRHFLRGGEATLLDDVVRHNAADVLSMVGLVALYGEPLGQLPAAELADVARVMKRAGNLGLADEAAHRAVQRGAGAEGLRARAEIAKARGDRVRALADFEAAAADLADPSLRLELAKLYEHFLHAPGRALEMVEEGTGEDEVAASKRRERLARKIQRADVDGRASSASPRVAATDSVGPAAESPCNPGNNQTASGSADTKQRSHPRPGWARVASR